MILADIPWLSLSINLLLVIFFFVCVMMVLLILMQRPKQEGLGATFGTNVTDQVFGARTTNVLQRGTVYLATAFFILSLTLAILIGHRNAKNSLIDKNAQAAPAPVVEAPAAPVVPAPTETPAPATTPIETPKTGDAPKTEEAPKTEAPAQPAAPVDAPAKPAEPAAPADAPAKPAEPAAPANGGEKPAGQ